jgi:hypothetical protein
MEMHPGIYRCLEGLSKQLGVTARYLSATKFLLQIPYCSEMLHWQLSFARVGAQRVPDFHFPEDDWSPLVQSDDVSACLENWRLDQESLLKLMHALLSRHVMGLPLLVLGSMHASAT